MMPDRLIDVPIEALPAIDEHSATIAATTAIAWDALIETLEEIGHSARARHGARVLHCMHRAEAGSMPDVGATMPGFVVARSVRPALLALLGEHRFARYAVVFSIVEDRSGLVLLSAESRAEFSHRGGRAYRGLVLGTRGHVGVTRGMLSVVRRRAERRATLEPAG